MPADRRSPVRLIAKIWIVLAQMSAGSMNGGIVTGATSSKSRWAELARALVPLLALVLAANLLVIQYVSSERYVYYWDYALYWRNFENLADLLRTDTRQAFANINYSLKYDEYTLLPVLPLAPFHWLMGNGRLPYILAITNIAVIPSAALLALLNEQLQDHWRWPRFIISMMAILSVHVLWAPALRGYPDAVGLVMASAILLVYFSKSPIDQRPLRFVWLGALLCLLILTRRWLIFWAFSFFPAALLAQMIARNSPKALWATSQRLALAGSTCLIILTIVAAPMLVRILLRNYPAAYAAYRSDAGLTEQLVGHFGLALIAISGIGLGWLAAHRSTRPIGVFLIAQTVIALGLFTRVQSLLGVQHYYLLMPSCGVGIAAAISLVWQLPLARYWRALGLAIICGTILLSSAVALSSWRDRTGPLLPTARFAPLIRGDIGEINRLLDRLSASPRGPIYVVSSSSVMNWSVLKVACEERRLTFCAQILSIEEVDTRDGFPRSIIGAKYVVLSTPTQYHLRASDQLTVGLVADAIRGHHGLGTAFEPVPGEFNLDQGVRITIYHRIAPTKSQDLQALSETLQRSYPAQKSLFKTPAL